MILKYNHLKPQRNTNTRLILTLGFGLFIQSSFAQNVWIRKDSVNGPPRGACASFTLNGEGFVAGGVNVEEFKRKMYSYDLEQDDWDNETALGGEAGSGLERASAVGFDAGGYGFIALGKGASACYKDLWRYDPETESWTQMADFMGTARSGAVAFEVDNIAYIGSGQDAEGLKDDFYKYTQSTNTWEAIGDFDGSARKEAVGFTMGGKGYMGTGRGEEGYFVDFWEYNPLEDSWSRKADFPGTPRLGAVGCGVFPTAFVMLGEDNDFEYKQDVWEYNYFGNVWTQRADYPGGSRTQASALVVDNRIFVGLGYNGIYHDDFYEYERILSVDDNKPAISFTIYPNPAQTYCLLRFTETVNAPGLKIYSTDGSDISAHFSITQENNGLRVEMFQPVAPGSYYAVLTDNAIPLKTQTIIFNP